MAEAKKMKSVAIVGAGPSGLISAHHLLSTGNFHVTIFEKTSSIGGLWPVSKTDNSRMIEPLMRANQSRHTVSFGSHGQRFYQQENGEMEEGQCQVDIFPKAWQVGRYLERLTEEVKGKGVKMELETEVVKVEKVDGEGDRWKGEGRARVSDEGMRWRVGTRKTATTDADAEVEEEQIFDFVIIASGFFGTPKIPTQLRPYLSTITPPPPSTPRNGEKPEATKVESPLGIPVIHSSHFRTLNTLLNTTSTPKPSAPTSGKRKILIIGGSMSGCEIASTIASEVSSLQYSPGTPSLPNPADYEIIHIASRPFYTLPRYLPLDTSSSAPTFLPCDLVFNNLVNRRGTRGTNNAGFLSPERAQKVHTYYRALSGQERAHAWIEGDDSEADAPWLAIRDSYTPHTLSGTITTFRGRLVNLHHSSKNSSVSAIITTPTGEQTLNDIAAVILATGFSSTSSLSILSEKIMEELGFREDSYMPLNLAWQSTVGRGELRMGFVGMYNGPFWGVMELQSKLLTSLFTRLSLSPEEREKMEEKEGEGGLLGGLKDAAGAAGAAGYLRRMEEENGMDGEWTRKRCSQFPMGDYIHAMTDLMALRGRGLDDDEIPETGCWPLVPDEAEVRGFLDKSAYETDVEQRRSSPARLAVQHTIDACLAGTYYPRNLFRALLGKWKLQRTITSKHPSYPSGTLTGMATFHPRTPTSPQYSGEYLYDESGDFRTDNGLMMRASRRYVWRLESGNNGKEGLDRVSQWFVKVSGPEKNLGVDYIFHELDIIRPNGTALSSSPGANGAACPMTPRPTTRIESPDREVRGGWASSHKAVDKAMVSLNLEDGKLREEEGKEGLWTAKGHHLCIDDTYDPEYVFKWKGCELESWTMGYTVKGPGKDYFIESTFTRPS